MCFYVFACVCLWFCVDRKIHRQVGGEDLGGLVLRFGMASRASEVFERGEDAAKRVEDA